MYAIHKDTNDSIYKKPSEVKQGSAGKLRDKDLLGYGKFKDLRRLDPRLVQHNLPYGKYRDGSAARMKHNKQRLDYAFPASGNAVPSVVHRSFNDERSTNRAALPKVRQARHNSDCDPSDEDFPDVHARRRAGADKKGYMTGKGVFHFHNGDSYEGEWRNGKMHGRGVYCFLKGDRYEGEYCDDAVSGRGSV